MEPILGAMVLPDGATQTAEIPIPPSRAAPSWSRFHGDVPTLGAHCYASEGPGYTAGTLRISNGAIYPDGTGFCGALYFDELRLDAPDGFEWVTLPQFGELVDGGVWLIATGGGHFFRARGILERAFALVKTNAPREVKLRARQSLRYSLLQIPDPVSKYGPYESRLPKVDRAAYESLSSSHELRLIRSQAAGVPDWIENVAQIQSPAFGPWWMDGNRSAGDYGGFGINPSDGYEQCPSSVLVHAILHRANMARHPVACYHADTGRPISLYDWVKPPLKDRMDGEDGVARGRVELTAFCEGGWGNYRYTRFNTGTCAYEQQILEYEPHDVAHAIRGMRHAIVLAELANDLAAKHDLAMMFEDWRYMHWSNRSDEMTDPNQGYVQSTLSARKKWIAASPNQGIMSDRAAGWIAVAGACALAYGGPTVNLNDIVWADDMLALFALSADKWGFHQRINLHELDNSLPVNEHGIQTFHEGLIALGIYALAKQRERLAEFGPLLLKKAESAYTLLPPAQYGGAVGPPHYIATTRDGNELPMLIGHGEGDPAHVLSTCALAYEATGDPAPLTWGLKHWHPHSSFEQRMAWLKALFPDRAWSAMYDASLEEYLG